ncbi:MULTISPECIES: inorganic diphosphatase [Methylobacterium]|uniref:inorganic diphosphatase n=2 Tax=Methylobacterium TaxID=407 RepID=A0A2R4WM18_9HYPH|nr:MULTISPECIES: inorganic diphosphatase [Methylobacterium]MBZ6411079.1 inorganic diphosphatase [Methylobacterium sp.]AWB22578.1 inorganic diphosphatase [Methylobacterium currus]MBK3397129.1 inorganic diphosphatase [Methylobacterium ajmalii]MBK3408344.1 inorganic diphosphatase [Methylobacterium ajmalii]MBK3421160.1 inorganic diphosphatase [Methylobacterium ajmalii]
MPQTAPPLSRLPTFSDDCHVHVVVETPKGSPNKYAFSDALGAFQFKMVLPEGTSFPYDFGMIPSTKGADGDPLDVLLLLDAPAFPGCVLEARLVGVIEAEQRERDGTWERNDRLVGVAVKARTHAHIHALDDLRPGMLDEVEAFFGHYNQLAGKDFKVLRRGDAEAALALVRHGTEAFGRACG